MHNNEFKLFLHKFMRFICIFSPILFWISLIFSFDSPQIATLTIIAIAIHEVGHIATIFLFGEKIEGFRAVLSGLRIRNSTASYGEEFTVYLAGPLANAIAALLGRIILPDVYASAFITVNTATCISNLLPIEGYDGYGLLRCALTHREQTRFAYALLDAVSMFFTATLLVLSLYLLDRYGEGYWLFFMFFFSTLKKISQKDGLSA